MMDQDHTDILVAPEPETDDWFGVDSSTFGDRLMGAREVAGLTRGQLAKRLGVKIATIERWEEDLAEPRANRLQMLAGILGVSMTWLLTAEGEGLDGPVATVDLGEDLRDVLAEIRQLKTEMRRSSERMAVVEKRLRKLLQDDPK